MASRALRNADLYDHRENLYHIITSTGCGAAIRCQQQPRWSCVDDVTAYVRQTEALVLLARWQRPYTWAYLNEPGGLALCRCVYSTYLWATQRSPPLASRTVKHVCMLITHLAVCISTPFSRQPRFTSTQSLSISLLVLPLPVAGRNSPPRSQPGAAERKNSGGGGLKGSEGETRIRVEGGVLLGAKL